MNTLSTQPVVAQINLAYEQFCSCAATSKEMQITGANHAREAGLLLAQYKKECRHGEFQKGFASLKGKGISDNIFSMSYEHGSLLMRIAARYPDPFTAENFPDRVRSLTDLLYAANELEEPDGHGEQQQGTAVNGMMALTRHLMAFTVAWDKFQGADHIAKLSPEEAEQHIPEIERVVEAANQILVLVRAKAYGLKAA